MDSKERTPQTSTEMFSVDLGKRTIKLDGVYYAGVVKSNSSDLIKKLNEELKKKPTYQVDIGNIDGRPIVLTISGTQYSGIVEVPTEGLRDELAYRSSMVKEGHRRQHSARNIKTTFQSVEKPPQDVVILRGGQ